MTAYPKPASGSPNFPALEADVLDYWDGDDTFRASIARRDGAPEYVFYDGPPFANGLPHYGHLLTGYVKDIVPRYRTMRGYKVERRFGWDTHGLPAELEVQRQLGISDKAQIEEMGIEKFNEACRASVLKYTNEWQAYVTRQARWVDFDNDYKTLDPGFMESVIWAFKQLWDKGLGLRRHSGAAVLLERRDPAVQPRVADGRRRLPESSGPGDHRRIPRRRWRDGSDGAYLLIWTTTPWTLPSNQAVAVNPEVDIRSGAGARRQAVRAGEGAAGGLRPRARRRARDPGHLHRPGPAWYALPAAVPVFHGLRRNAFRVSARRVRQHRGRHRHRAHVAGLRRGRQGDHGQASGIVAVTPVDSKGRFDETVPDYAGQHVFDANPQIIRDLKNHGRSAAVNGPVLLRHETYEHSYPHCWRCRNPLIYRAVSSWFIKVTEFRDRMVELNKQITWYPEHVKDGQFGKWLQGARDWSISRNRYWGTPIPVWMSDDPGVSAHRRVRQPRRVGA